ncbi:glycosyltransferase family 1 protein [Calocera cornea HHB12733]|uniref:Glycosyltransferase family 1 protein n=1 Tax=Calocera cornea HHB12733 TaxID=1353952 RepID=A0A165FFJ2_9BASI|nr:glycosyltransferase family 1 protein [Calocera cornea HHB12733]
MSPSVSCLVPVVVTYTANPSQTAAVIADASFQINAQDEVDRVVYENEKDVLKRIRVIAAGRALAGITPEIMADLGRFDPRTFRIPSSQFTQDVQAVFHHVMKGESFQDDNGVLWDGISQKPSLLITDMFMADVAAPMRELYQLKTYMYWISFSAALTRAFGPLAFGGQAQGFLEECHAIEADPARKKGRSFVEIATQVCSSSCL